METGREQSRHRAPVRPTTALKGPVKGTWYKCYVILDIFSRYVTGWLVAAAEDAVVARDFLADAIARNGCEPHTVHADRGGAMVSKPVSELLTDLGVLRSHSRPRTSNDNPYSDYAEVVVMPSTNPSTPGSCWSGCCGQLNRSG